MLRFGLILAAAVVVLDQASKYWVLEVLRFSPPGCRQFGGGCGFIELSPLFDLRMVWNYGVSFGMLRAGGEWERWGLVILSAGISAMFLWWLKGAARRVTAIALGLVIGGAIGNMIDRVRFGAVADFFDFSGLYFPWVFNVADAAITCGAILLALDFLLNPEPKTPAATAPAPETKEDGASEAPGSR